MEVKAMFGPLECSSFPVPNNEERRIRVLQECNILDSSNYEVPIALISFVDVNRQWFKSVMGLTIFETGRDVSFCAHAIAEVSEDVFVILDATKDERFCNNPFVTGPPFVRFYAGASLNVADCKLGGFSIIDSEPRSEFTLNDKMNLMDLTEAVSCLIRKRREANLLAIEAKELSFENLILDIKQPLADLSRIVHKLSDSGGGDVTKVEVEGGLTSIKNLEISLSHLNTIVDNARESSTSSDHTKSTSDTLSVSSFTPKVQKGTPTSAHSTDSKNSNHVKIKVLLMEDSIPTQKVISRWCMTHGCEITVADNGMIGLIHLKTEKFDIVLVDFLMPVMDGVECVKEYAHWRKDNKADDTVVYNSNMLIIGMSSTASSAEQTQAFKNGMHAFTSKPVDMTILQLAVNLKKNKTDLMACSDALHSHFSCGFIFEDVESGKSPTISRLKSGGESTDSLAHEKGHVENDADTNKKLKVKKSFFGMWSFTQKSGSNSGNKSKIFPK